MMNHKKLSLFGASILSGYSIEVDDAEGNTIATFEQNSSAEDFATEVLKHDYVGLGIYYEKGDWCHGGMSLIKQPQNQASEPRITIENYSKGVEHLVPHNHDKEVAITMGG